MYLYSRQDQAVSLWLTIMCFAVVAMVFVGGLTRLTDSGLSMTEWKPVTGLLPPLDMDEWYIEFGKYKKSPEYQKINNGMSIEEFQSIYWLEYIHRMLGRAIVLLFILPLIFFIARGNIRGPDIVSYIVIGLLFALQGIMGWYMVKSGLADQPHVSHLRLASHLILALIIYSLLFWQKMRNSFDIMLVAGEQQVRGYVYFFYIALLLVFIQIFIGGMVAGLNAGLVYNTYPLMGEHFMAEELHGKDITVDSFFDPIFVQFIHRIGAIIVFLMIGILSRKCIKSDFPKLKEAASFCVFSITLQAILGILTLQYAVPISYALAHQLGSIFLLSSLLWGLFLVKNA